VSYIPQSDSDQARMLQAMGLQSAEELFEQIPQELRDRAVLDLPRPLSEPELARHIAKLAASNCASDRLTCFAGGGIYDRFIPAIVSDVARRPEFVTPYTPYQAEVSQGTLQAMFEYQTMVCELTSLPVANASLYDGATALAEAVLMAAAITGRSRAVISQAVSPAARAATRTACSASGVDIIEVGYCADTGRTDVEALGDLLDDELCCVALQQPNYFGIIEDMATAAQATHSVEALFVASVEPISLGLLQPPGAYDADIVVGEGQPLGLPISFGGPLLGLMACKQQYLRHMPGRLSGRTTDEQGRTGYCLTLQAREQHIRRDRATSNICTAQQLCALTAAVYMAAVGPEGLREVAQLNLDKTHYLWGRLTDAGLPVQPRLSGSFFGEFVVQADRPAEQLIEQLSQKGYLVGPAIGRDYPELCDCLLLSATEQRTRDEVDGLVAALADL
jgi:glycine dehydrogenase subunit 1